MRLTLELTSILRRSSGLHEILHGVLTMLVRRLRADGAVVWLVGRAEATAVGAPCAGALLLAKELAADHGAHQELLTVREVGGTSIVGVPMLLRGRPVGALVVHRPPDGARAPNENLELVTLGAQLAEIVTSAQFLADVSPAATFPPRRARRARTDEEVVLKGVAASPGVGIGTVAFRGVHELSLDELQAPSSSVVNETARARHALDSARSDILRLQTAAAHEIDEEHALIFGAHLLVLGDPSLTGAIARRIEQRATAAVAIDGALRELEARLHAVGDPYLQERADDLDDLRGRLLSYVLGARRSHRGAPGVVLVSRRIPPSLVVELQAERAAGVLVESASPTSHGVLLARALGLPVVAGIADVVVQVAPGDRVVVDGDTGVVVLRPAGATLERYEKNRVRLERRRTAHARYRDRPTVSADGTRVPLFANVGVVQDLTTAKENGAEGVGLYRTEFPFLVRGQFPTRDEQERIYARAYEVFPAAPIHFRVLDLGGDKFIAHDEVQASRDPFHGYRGLRVLFDHPHVLIEQVQAFAAAAGARPVSILLPMVTSLDELRRAKAIVLGACPVPRSAPLSIGVMVEVPGAVEIARHLAAEVDFVSIGTNDLVQYALVRDREDPRMSSPTDGYHPAVLAMVARTIAAVHAAGRPVQVCGEIAARPDLAALLVAMGVDGLSLAPRSIPEVKRALASARIAPIRDALGSLLACGDAAEVQARLREVSTRRPTAGRT